MLMSSSIACERGTIMMKPEVGLGVVGMNTHTCGSPVCALISGTSPAVWKPMLQIPLRGYSISSTFLNELPWFDRIVVEKLLTPLYSARTNGMRSEEHTSELQ